MSDTLEAPLEVLSHTNPVIYEEANTRSAFLRKVGVLSFFGLVIAMISGTVSAAILMLMPVLLNQMVSMIIMFGSFGVVHFIARPMVYSAYSGARFTGFTVGAMFQGIAMGYLLLAAVSLSLDLFENPFVLVGQAMGLTGLTAFGMLIYLATGPKSLNYIAAIMPMLGLPMLALMVISFIFPLTGPLGLLLCAAFVVFSAVGLLYQLNIVLHRMPADMVMQASFEVMIGLLVLFWNILSLLMRLQRR